MVFSFRHVPFKLERPVDLERAGEPHRGFGLGWMRLFSWNLFAAMRFFSNRGCGPRQPDAAVLRTSGFFRFLLMANEMAGELPTRPVRRLIPFSGEITKY
ncbi:hypothetical protein [Rhizobium laguerreae]|uniref:hypothetical protein n=1 Tax=Rhizobium laguerreae TaxID=1076926 RepID=UPI001C917B25|nr:hypothetical protein [Rhizobium laguerreae]MBY3366176.1 hypothetical protein [Rhizobium laguerreae]MBY3514525.1 hypothetical protein [Rhizobium laguerreae]